MGLAMDTIGFFATNPGSGGAAATVAPGDSFTVRNFAPTDQCFLDTVVHTGSPEGFVQITSPMLHDDVRGIRFTTANNPSVFLMPQDYGQKLVAQDTLAVSVSGPTANSVAGIMGLWYSNLIGSSSRLHSWGDISGIIKNIKPTEVDVTSSATIGTWVDTLFTTTEDLTHAYTDYAVLGYLVDVACLAVGVKGQETGNLRVCGPGTPNDFATMDYFVVRSAKSGRPCIPIINSANKGSIYVSIIHDVASVAVKVQLILAELTQNLTT